MTFHRENFQPYNIEKYSTVTAGNDMHLKVEEKGTIFIKKLVNGEWEDSQINDVLHAPGLKRDMFSEGVVTGKGMTVMKKGNSVCIQASGHTEASGVKKQNNLCNMLFKSVNNNQSNFVEDCSSLKTWHE